MGDCVSVHKDPSAAMRIRVSFGSKEEGVLIPSPIKEKPIINVDRPISEIGYKSQWPHSQPVTSFHNLGSKEENFFDSQPWLESDCEDDFFSVNGDFTPSRGNTPVHHRFSVETPTGNRTPGPKPEPSPRKRLSELFEESLREDQDADKQYKNAVNGKLEGNETASDLPPKSENSTPFVSGATSVCSSERITNGNDATEKKNIKYAQCCLPSMLSSRSFHERRKTSPAQSMG